MNESVMEPKLSENPFENPKLVPPEKKEENKEIEMEFVGKSVVEGEKRLLYEIFPSKNKFYCGGRLLTGPDRWRFYVAVLMLWIPSGLWFGFV